jgi:hypothetical protein
MSGAWNWWAFVPTLIMCTIAVEIVRGRSADRVLLGHTSQTRIAPRLLSSIIAGAAIAVVITLTVGEIIIAN